MLCGLLLTEQTHVTQLLEPVISTDMVVLTLMEMELATLIQTEPTVRLGQLPMEPTFGQTIAHSGTILMQMATETILLQQQLETHALQPVVTPAQTGMGAQTPTEMDTLILIQDGLLQMVQMHSLQTQLNGLIKTEMVMETTQAVTTQMIVQLSQEHLQCKVCLVA